MAFGKILDSVKYLSDPAAMPAVAKNDTQRVAAVRRFNRFYTQHLGVLNDGFLDSPFSLTQARVLYEIRQRGSSTATDIGRDLGLDAGYLSRLVAQFEKSGLIRKERSPSDGRQSFLSITAMGRKAMDHLEQRTVRQVGDVLHRLSDPEQDRLVSAMRSVERMMAPAPGLLSMTTCWPSASPSRQRRRGACSPPPASGLAAARVSRRARCTCSRRRG